MQTLPTAVAALLAGVIAGFLIGRASAPVVGSDAGKPPAGNSPGAPEPTAQTGVLSEVKSTGSFDVYYPLPYTSPPALSIIDKHPPGEGWGYKIVEQRADGFRIDINAGGGRLLAHLLSYVARGRLAEGDALVQNGTAMVPTGDPGICEVYYRTPYPTPPQLTLLTTDSAIRIVEQKATGFRLERREQSGISQVPIKWKAEQVLRK